MDWGTAAVYGPRWPACASRLGPDKANPAVMWVHGKPTWLRPAPESDGLPRTAAPVAGSHTRGSRDVRHGAPGLSCPRDREGETQ